MRHLTMWCAAGGLAIAALVAGRMFQAAPGAIAIAPADRSQTASDTSRDGLARAIRTLSARVAAHASDEHAAVQLSDALMRQARVTGDATLPKQAEDVLKLTIDATDGYLPRRTMGAVYLAQHRFAEALEAGRRAQALRPDDPWNYGVIGDAAIELGRYDDAFAAFDRMAALKPSAASYSRVAYARELQGDLDGARTAMQMAAEATSAHDPEGLAWAWSQLGALELQLGRLDEAARACGRALFAFPRHPYALGVRARVAIARDALGDALEIYTALHAGSPTPELAAQIGDTHAATGRGAAADAAWDEAQRLEREGWAHEAPQPGALARMLAERNLETDEAVRLAREASSRRDDIFTNDALAWALFRAGSYDEAWSASLRARRTGTRDGRILYHAAAIAEARGDLRAAQALAARAVEGNARFDLIAAPAAKALLSRVSGR
jgi:tetratricopeptide (TPR) repeat protein